MEKLKPNFKIFSIMLITISSLIVLVFNYFEIIKNNQFPYMLLIGPYVATIFYFAEKNAKSGYYFSNDGILIKSKKSEIFTPWKEIKLFQRSSKKHEIQITKDIFIRPFNLIDQNSIIGLLEKYCPQGHELHKLVEDYAKNK